MDQDWPIPGLSKWGSRNAKEFLKTITCRSFWPQHAYFAADTTHGPTIDPNCIERTKWEGRTLLFTVQGLLHWRRVDDGGNHWVYWPCMLLVGCIGNEIGLLPLSMAAPLGEKERAAAFSEENPLAWIKLCPPAPASTPARVTIDLKEHLNQDGFAADAALWAYPTPSGFCPVWVETKYSRAVSRKERFEAPKQNFAKKRTIGAMFEHLLKIKDDGV
jgi:hypothetical protein